MLLQVKQQETDVDFPFLNKAFPDFPEGEVPLAIQAGGWEDTSYQHDATPSFAYTAEPNLRLFVNRFYPEDRYEGPGAPRFNLCYDSDEGSQPCWLYAGESLDEMMEMVNGFMKGRGKMSTVARTILEQLGGQRFVLLTGAKSFAAGAKSLSFRLPGGQGLVITLNGNDTYDIDHFVLRGTTVKDKGRREGIYCDMLQDVFENMTGFYTTLRPRRN